MTIMEHIYEERRAAYRADHSKHRFPYVDVSECVRCQEAHAAVVARRDAPRVACWNCGEVKAEPTILRKPECVACYNARMHPRGADMPVCKAPGCSNEGGLASGYCSGHLMARVDGREYNR